MKMKFNGALIDIDNIMKIEYDKDNTNSIFYYHDGSKTNVESCHRRHFNMIYSLVHLNDFIDIDSFLEEKELGCTGCNVEICPVYDYEADEEYYEECHGDCSSDCKDYDLCEHDDNPDKSLCKHDDAEEDVCEDCKKDDNIIN